MSIKKEKNYIDFNLINLLRSHLLVWWVVRWPLLLRRRR